MAKKIKNKFDYLELMGADKDELASFTLLDKKTMERLMIDGKVDIPKKKVDIPKDEQWNMKTLGSKLLLGIQNGDSIPKIADSFQEVIGNNRASAVRNARTMTTSAECHGRMDSYEDLAKQGVIQKKHWIATGDNRTRDTHLELDGQERDIDEAFSNGLMFPGDASGEPSEVWNCRCSIASKIVGFRKADGSISKVADVNEPESAHEKQIREEKEKRGIAEEGRKEPESTHEKRIQEERERSKAEEGRKTSAPAEKILDSLIDSYEYHRQHNNTRALPAEKITGDFFKIQFTKMDDELKDAIADQFESLASRYDTTVVEIRPMDAMEYTGKKNAFATTFHDYTVDISTIMYNPVKITDVERTKELIDNGYSAKIDKNLANRYVITHEFAHTLVDMGSKLNNKTNWLDADYDKIKSARKEINKVYDRYIADVGNLDNQKKAAELEAMTTMDQNAWNRAAELGKELSSKFVSRYSLVNSDEFMAECFAHHELGGAQNDYVDEIMEIIERYFGREEE